MIFYLLAQVVRIYTFVIFGRILITWIPNLDPYNPAVQILRQITDPVLEPARKVIPPIGMIDISAIVVLVALGFLQQILLDMSRGF